jgi:NADH:ubiquinone oxidoreductase subunit F (NADH-binding)
LAQGAESLAAHRARLGDLPIGRADIDVIGMLEASGLRGRGGAGFPVGRKWRALASARSGPTVVVANGAEGEPGSVKDRTLMTARPHLIIDGAELAADAIGADELVFYVGGEHSVAVASMQRAIDERARTSSFRMRLVSAPVGYVAGEATAAVNFIDRADARPTGSPPRMSERGVGGRPTLVQNVETLAYAALIGRYGDRWYRSAGRLGYPGTALVTLSGAVRDGGVHEIESGTPLSDAVDAAGGTTTDVGAVVLGGYFGTWARREDVWDLPLDPTPMQERGLSFGCGIIGLLASDACGVVATARIMSFMSQASAGQCGPCVNGLGSIDVTAARIATCEAGPDELERIERWTALLVGRGACRHPDGAAQLMSSALAVFGDDFVAHTSRGRCAVTGTAKGSAAGSTTVAA